VTSINKIQESHNSMQCNICTVH